MKGAIAAFIAAVPPVTGTKGSVSLLITGDEEGLSVDGTRPQGTGFYVGRDHVYRAMVETFSSGPPSGCRAFT